MCSFLTAEDGKDGLLSADLEDTIEELSAAAGPGGCEAFLNHWAKGTYLCARCREPLYSSSAKWQGPCAWPSFRAALDGALQTRPVEHYNNYTCAVAEVFCSSCRLFLGHKFEDAREKGDDSPECTGWRH